MGGGRVTTGEQTYTVRLVGVPVRVLEAGRRHHEELMHEFSLLAVQEDIADDVPKRVLYPIETLGSRYAATSEQSNTQVDAALARGDTTVDVTYEVAAH